MWHTKGWGVAIAVILARRLPRLARGGGRTVPVAWQRVEGALAPVLTLIPDVEQVRGVARTAYTLSLFVSPAVAIALTNGGWIRIRQHRWFLLGTSVVVVTGVVIARGDFLLGNYVTRFGSYPETVSGPLPSSYIPPCGA